ncbi:MAG: glycerol-3-phosphate acyltransferase, partial [Chloroflexi bacterium]
MIFSIVAIIIGYLSGSIPMGYLVARLYGVDVTSTGSGRIGGTNVLRAAGATAAGLTVLGDVLKGMIPTLLLVSAGMPLTASLAGAAAVLGHNHSIFLRFRGGVGAGTAIGVIGALSFPVGLLTAFCGLVALALSRYASILSTTIAVSSVVFLTLFAWLGYTPYEYIAGAVVIMLLIVNALRPNYARLRAGTER